MCEGPLVVQRGVYIGECSRLAVLCSTKENYIGAIKDLNTLYAMRGYPSQLVTAWCKKNVQERWDKRFASRVENVGNDEGVHVLKTRFNDVWNWFSAAELGKQITEYWAEWYTRAETGNYMFSPSRPFSAPEDSGSHGITEVAAGLYCMVRNANREEVWVPDLRKIGILGRRWLVSRKRNINVFDLSSQWKKAVFEKMSEMVIADNTAPSPQILDADDAIVPDPGQVPEIHINVQDNDSDDDIYLHQRSSSDDEEHPLFGRASKRTN